jgi:shikimate dehydrogenase
MDIDRYAVIGHHIGYSRSPRIHRLFAGQCGQALEYSLIDVAPEQFAATARAFFAGGGRGLNVTVPYKQAAMALATRLSARAQRAGALNTLAADAAGVLGDNTDGAGLVRDLTLNLGLTLRGARVLLLGAGGAARGILAPLLEAQPAALVIHNRNASRAQQLAAEFADLGAVRAGHAAGDSYELILNATSASAHGELPAMPARCVAAHTLCYDLAYRESATAFVQWARAAGAARALMGLGMLVEQAAESFLLWRGVRPDTAPVLALLAATPDP